MFIQFIIFLFLAGSSISLPSIHPYECPSFKDIGRQFSEISDNLRDHFMVSETQRGWLEDAGREDLALLLNKTDTRDLNKYVLYYKNIRKQKIQKIVSFLYSDHHPKKAVFLPFFKACVVGKGLLKSAGLVYEFVPRFDEFLLAQQASVKDVIGRMREALQSLELLFRNGFWYRGLSPDQLGVSQFETVEDVPLFLKSLFRKHSIQANGRGQADPPNVYSPNRLFQENFLGLFSPDLKERPASVSTRGKVRFLHRVETKCELDSFPNLARYLADYGKNKRFSPMPDAEMLPSFDNCVKMDLYEWLLSFEHFFELARGKKFCWKNLLLTIEKVELQRQPEFEKLKTSDRKDRLLFFVTDHLARRFPEQAYDLGLVRFFVKYPFYRHELTEILFTLHLLSAKYIRRFFLMMAEDLLRFLFGRPLILDKQSAGLTNHENLFVKEKIHNNFTRRSFEREVTFLNQSTDRAASPADSDLQSTEGGTANQEDPWSVKLQLDAFEAISEITTSDFWNSSFESSMQTIRSCSVHETTPSGPQKKGQTDIDEDYQTTRLQLLLNKNSVVTNRAGSLIDLPPTSKRRQKRKSDGSVRIKLRKKRQMFQNSKNHWKSSENAQTPMSQPATIQIDKNSEIRDSKSKKSGLEKQEEKTTDTQNLIFKNIHEHKKILSLNNSSVTNFSLVSLASLSSEKKIEKSFFKDKETMKKFYFKKGEKHQTDQKSEQSSEFLRLENKIKIYVFNEYGQGGKIVKTTYYNYDPTEAVDNNLFKYKKKINIYKNSEGAILKKIIKVKRIKKKNV